MNRRVLVLAAGAALIGQTALACSDIGSADSAGNDNGGGAFPGSGGFLGGTGGTTGAGGASSTGGSGTGGSAGNSGTGGSSAGGAGPCTGSCCPTDAACYPNGNPGPGAECLARRDNVAAERVQLRQVWVDPMAPQGFATSPLRALFSRGTELAEPACGTPDGTGSFVELFELDLRDPDLSRHTARLGFAAPVDDPLAAHSDGLCFRSTIYEDGPWSSSSALGTGDGYPTGLPAPLAQPWAVQPVRAKRVGTDFDLAIDRAALLADLAEDPEFDGIFFYEAATGVFHGYAPLLFQILRESPDRDLPIPLREVEIRRSFNDPFRPNCIGRLTGACGEDGGAGAAWSCTAPGCSEPPATMNGYVLSAELEQVFSESLDATLCAAAPTLAASASEGFSDPDAWGQNCRGAPAWNPDDARTGLPAGTWCASTNSGPTETCHDAYRFSLAQAFAAFPIQESVCRSGPDPEDAAAACPGRAITVDLGATERLVSNTAPLGEEVGDYCGDGPDTGAIFAVTPSDAGTLFVDVFALSNDAGLREFDGLVFVQSECDSASTTTACASDARRSRVAVPVGSGETRFVFVQSSSPFDLSIRLEASRCGDGVRNTGEECDLGDRRAGDGCDASCRFEAPTDLSDVCPGETSTISPDQPLAVSGYTVGYADDYSAPCRARAGAADRVFGVTPTVDGTLRAEIGARFDAVLSLYSNCAAPELGSLLACSDGPRARDVESLSVRVRGGRQYFLVVDGYATDSIGQFGLDVSITP